MTVDIFAHIGDACFYAELAIYLGAIKFGINLTRSYSRSLRLPDFDACFWISDPVSDLVSSIGSQEKENRAKS